jgi:DNA-binding response OmpR family regulator
MSEIGRVARRRALVVDRDEAHLAFVAEALSSFRPGFEVATARDLDQAEEWLDTFHPDLLLLDLDLPVEATDHLTERLREDPRTRNCKILGIGPDRPAARRAEATLPRPLHLKTLLSAVQKLI